MEAIKCVARLIISNWLIYTCVDLDKKHDVE